MSLITETQEKLNKIFGQSCFYKIIDVTNKHVWIETYLSLNASDINEIAKEGLIFSRVIPFVNELNDSGLRICFNKK